MPSAKILFALCCATSAFCADLDSDPVFGFWQLNNAKSRLAATPPPVSMFRRYQPEREGLTRISEIRLDPGGTQIEVDYVASYDGEECPLYFRRSDNHALVKSNLTVSFRRIDRRRVEGVFRTQGKETYRFTRVVSKDGRRLHVRIVEIDSSDQKAITLLVYDRMST
jgi:hypothetical protein